MKKYSLFISTLLFATTGLFATTPAAKETADDDVEIRENPELEIGSSISRDYKSYPFLKLDKNNINMNGRTWHDLYEKFKATQHGGIVNIVQIGDSHVQADGNGGKVRKLLQQQYGNAGRGLMIPFRLAGTNQPLDYKITSSSPFTSAKLMRMPWPTQMGFTGISLFSESSKPTFNITSPTAFAVLNIYGEGKFNIEAVKAYGKNAHFTAEPQKWGVQVTLDDEVTNAEIVLGGYNFNIFGFDARRDEKAKGVLYHTIGNNGATYSMYSLIGNIGKSLTVLTPDLVIISLGTNEAFGKMSDATFYANIDLLVNDIRKHNPDAEILLTTPSECQRSAYVTTAVRRRGKGRRRRTTTKVRTYQVNSNVNRLRNVIIKYGAEKQIAVYDFYEAAGGVGSSAKWLQNRLLSSDRIHRTWAGYALEGELLYHALSDALVDAGEHKDKTEKTQHKHTSAKTK
jgi:lysophospholipase L1-like esterase